MEEGGEKRGERGEERRGGRGEERGSWRGEQRGHICYRNLTDMGMSHIGNLHMRWGNDISKDA